MYRWFARLRDDGAWERINHHLVLQDRERVGREAGPLAAFVDSQSARTAEAGGHRSRDPSAKQSAAEPPKGGWDAGQKVKGRKRHTLVDTDGRLLKITVHPTEVRTATAPGRS